jgi:hypothetical protein
MRNEINRTIQFGRLRCWYYWWSARWDGLRWHDTQIPSFVTIGSVIQVILTVLPQQLEIRLKKLWASVRLHCYTTSMARRDDWAHKHRQCERISDRRLTGEWLSSAYFDISRVCRWIANRQVERMTAPENNLNIQKPPALDTHSVEEGKSRALR